MESYINIEKRLLALDRELHAILNLIRERHTFEEKHGAVSETLGAWGYDIDSREFVDNLRKSKRMDWIK